MSATRQRYILPSKKILSYMVDWVSFFLTERQSTLFFQGSPNIAAPVSVGTPLGSPLSPLLFLVYLASIHSHIPARIMVSYMDDLCLTVASPSYRSNIQRLQGLFPNISRRASGLEVSFSVAKTELIHWWTPSQRSAVAPHHP